MRRPDQSKFSSRAPRTSPLFVVGTGDQAGVPLKPGFGLSGVCLWTGSPFKLGVPRQRGFSLAGVEAQFCLWVASSSAIGMSQHLSPPIFVLAEGANFVVHPMPTSVLGAGSVIEHGGSDLISSADASDSLARSANDGKGRSEFS